MEYAEENQILLHEELCAKPVDEDDRIVKATIRFRENIKLANYAANQFSTPRDPAIDKEDILQSAYEGLWHACLDFDDSLGYKFSVYAVPTIKGYILRMLYNTEVISTTRTDKSIRAALNRHGFTLPLSDMEIDILLEEKVASRAQLVNYSEIKISSLESSVPGTEDLTLADTLYDESSDISISLSDEEIEEIIDTIISYIRPSSRDIVEEWLYSVLAEEPLRQVDLAKKYNVSREWVRVCMQSAIEAVRLHGKKIRNLLGY